MFEASRLWSQVTEKGRKDQKDLKDIKDDWNETTLFIGAGVVLILSAFSNEKAARRGPDGLK